MVRAGGLEVRAGGGWEPSRVMKLVPAGVRGPVAAWMTDLTAMPRALVLWSYA